MIKSLNHITDRLYEVELLEPEIEQREPIIVGFLFNKMLNKERLNSITFSSKKFCNVDKYREHEMHTYPLYSGRATEICKSESV